MDDVMDDQGEARLDPKTLLWLLAGHLRDRVVTHPVSTLGGAAMVGYVLGWGMPRPMLRLGAALVMRAALVEVLEEVLGSAPARGSEDELESSASRPRVEVHPRSTTAHRRPAADPFVA